MILNVSTVTGETSQLLQGPQSLFMTLPTYPTGSSKVFLSNYHLILPHLKTRSKACAQIDPLGEKKKEKKGKNCL